MKLKEKQKKIVIKAPLEDNVFLSWYEIPVLNLKRAIDFYSPIFGLNFEIFNTVTHQMALFPPTSGISGALVMGDGCLPSQCGPLLYLNGGSDLSVPMSKVESGGGKILMGKTLISEEIGFYSLILDSEGNRLAFFSKS